MGLTRFLLSKIQRLMATSQGSATGSDKGRSAKFIRVPSILSSVEFVSILFLLPSCYRGDTRLMDCDAENLRLSPFGGVK